MYLGGVLANNFNRQSFHKLLSVNAPLPSRHKCKDVGEGCSKVNAVQFQKLAIKCVVNYLRLFVIYAYLYDLTSLAAHIIRGWHIEIVVP